MSTTPTPFRPTGPTIPIANLGTASAMDYRSSTRPLLGLSPKTRRLAPLYLLATCSYVTSGFTIFFEEDSGDFNLMEQPPTGVFMNLVTYYAASWPTSGIPGQREMPKHVTITDAYGDHKVHVKE